MTSFAEAQKRRNEFYQNNPGPQATMTDQVKSFKQEEHKITSQASDALRTELTSLSKSSDPELLKSTVSQVDFQSKLSVYRSDEIEKIIHAQTQNAERVSRSQNNDGYQKQFINRDGIDEEKQHEEKFNAFMREKGRVPVEGEMEKFTAKPTLTQSEKPWEQKPKAQSM